jgi:pimeloyl-ACP methyl ester carboxylesterase
MIAGRRHRDRSARSHTERGTLSRLPFAAIGVGEPVVVLAGLAPMTGFAGDGMLRTMVGPFMPLAQSRRIIAFNRRPDLPRGMTLAELADEHAQAIQEGFRAPVDLVGTSTGGSIAQQLAADHPELVRSLVLISTACRLGPTARTLQSRVAIYIRDGAPRKAMAVFAAGLVPPWRGRLPAALAAYVLASRLAPGPHDLDDMATTIEAEDGFDLADGTAIQAPTLIMAGKNDRFYSEALFQETRQLIPSSRLRLFENRGHITVLRDPGLQHELTAFLST